MILVIFLIKPETAMLNTDYGIGEVRALASQIENETDKVGFKNVFDNSQK